MVTAEHACSGVKGQPAGGEEVLPDPLPTGSGVLPVEGVWQVHRSVGVAEIIIVEQPGSTELVLEGSRQRFGEDGEAVPLALAIADDDLSHGVIQVFHPEPGALARP